MQPLEGGELSPRTRENLILYMYFLENPLRHRRSPVDLPVNLFGSAGLYSLLVSVSVS